MDTSHLSAGSHFSTSPFGLKMSRRGRGRGTRDYSPAFGDESTPREYGDGQRPPLSSRVEFRSRGGSSSQSWRDDQRARGSSSLRSFEMHEPRHHQGGRLRPHLSNSRRGNPRYDRERQRFPSYISVTEMKQGLEAGLLFEVCSLHSQLVSLSLSLSLSLSFFFFFFF